MFTGSEFPTSGADSPGPAQDSQASDRQGRSPGQRAAFSHPDRIDNTRPSGKVFGVRTGTTCLPPDWIKGLHGAGVGSVSQDEYRRRALECIAVSRLVKNSEYRVLLLDMAQAWLRLADYAVMSGDTAAAIATQTETDQEK